MSQVHGESPACSGGRGHSSSRDIGTLFRRHGDAFRRANSLGTMERRALRDISVCRTGALGGHRDVCPNCGCEREVYNSCRNRACPKCQALRQARWVAERKRRALPVRHFHVVFTLPAELRELVRAYEAPLLDLLFASAAATLLQIASDPKRLGGLLGITAVVHTWGRNLIFHPHLHCIVTGGGLDAESGWVDSYEKYLLPVEVLRALFRGKFLDGLTRLFREGKLLISPRISERVASLLEPSAFAQLKDTLYGKDWVVFTKAPFKKPDALFRYLGLYTHRVAISNHRILHVDDNSVVFRTRDKKVCQLTPLEFMRRFLLHVLPFAFVKIRHFGLYAAGNVNSKLAVARAALERQHEDETTKTPHATTPDLATLTWRELFHRLTGIDLGSCPNCGCGLTSAPLSQSRHPSRAPPPGQS
ncbi:MAG TPA: IS91 family transposase [Polyangia bacterium]